MIRHTDKGRRKIRLTAIMLLGALFLILCPPLAGQTPKARVPFEGTHVFRNLLYRQKPLEKVADLKRAPKETLLIVLGETTVLDELQQVDGGLKGFLNRGGAVLIATDRPDKERLRSLKLRVDGLAVHQPIQFFLEDINAMHRGRGRAPPVPADELLIGYRNNHECPLITDVARFAHPIFRGVTKGIATNQPSYVRVLEENDLQSLSRFPRNCGIEGVGELSEDMAFVVGTASDSGPEKRVLVLAGHGVFINGMMAQPDNDNFTFAGNCVRWLTNGGQRKYALFVEDGKVVTNFQVSLKEMPPLPLPTSHLIGKLLRALEEENVINRLLHKFRGQILRIVLLGVSLGLLVYGLLRLQKARHRLDARVPLVTAHAALTVSDLSLLSQRQLAVLKENNLWEASRTLVRQWFEEHVGPWVAQLKKPPTVTLQGKRWRNWSVRKQVQQLWQLAYGTDATPITSRRFTQLVATLKELAAALAAGTLQFEEPGHAVV